MFSSNEAQRLPSSMPAWVNGTIVYGLCVVFVLATTSSVVACKYTVRDVAFVDMDHSWYQLFLYVDEETLAEDRDLLRTVVERGLSDSNVLVRFVDVQQDTSETALAHLKTLGIDSYPCAVLESPEGRIRQITLPAAEGNQPDKLRQSINSLVQSEKRDAILLELESAHSITLIIESDDEEQNQRAQAMVTSAIDQITPTLVDLPKPIDGAPLVMKVSAEEVRKESILLWSLGLEPDALETTKIAMMFGRGRNLGTPLDVGETNEKILLRRLAIVGLDCECDLDRSWMQAPMVPHRWTESDESRIAGKLGFDPGHPLTKVEISRILSRGPAAGGSGSGGMHDSVLPGLQMIELGFEEESDESHSQGNSRDGELANLPIASPLDSEESQGNEDSSHQEKSNSGDALEEQSVTGNAQGGSEQAPSPDRELDLGLKLYLFTLLGLIVLSLIGGGVVVLRKRYMAP